MIHLTLKSLCYTIPALMVFTLEVFYNSLYWNVTVCFKLAIAMLHYNCKPGLTLCPAPPGDPVSPVFPGSPWIFRKTHFITGKQKGMGNQNIYNKKLIIIDNYQASSNNASSILKHLLHPGIKIWSIAFVILQVAFDVMSNSMEFWHCVWW